METQKLQARKFIINYGLLLGLVSIGMSVVLYVLNMHMQGGMLVGLLSFVIMAIIIVYAISQYKKNNGAYLTLGEAIKIGVGVALIAGILVAIYNFIFMNYIEPEFMQKMLDMQFEKMVEDNPNMTQEQIDMSMEMGKKFSSPWLTTAFSIIGSMFFGLIISLIAGLVMKKENTHA